MQKILGLFVLLIILGCNQSNEGDPQTSTLELVYIFVGDESLSVSSTKENIPIDQPIEIRFSKPIQPSAIQSGITLLEGENAVQGTFGFMDSNQLVTIEFDALEESSSYILRISEGTLGENNEHFPGIEISFITELVPIEIISLLMDGQSVNVNNRIIDAATKPSFQMTFNRALLSEQLEKHINLNQGGSSFQTEVSQLNDSSFEIKTLNKLEGYSAFQLKVDGKLSTELNRPFEEFTLNFHTKLDSVAVFPELSDEELLTKIQEQTFKYFWDFAHPSSGLTRERSTSNDLVTIGGSGFGVMAIIVGIERGFITREEGIERLEIIVDFLGQADRFHGVWSHWLNGDTGDVIPFSSDDDGGDLVETSFLIQGLLTARQYLNINVVTESEIITKINNLWQSVEWDWHTQDDQEVLYWHWSPNFGWQKNHKITGWNEALITYVLAVASPTYNVHEDTYLNGWTRDGAFVNTSNTSHYGYTLDLRSDKGGPLFFSHYSFLGLDPRNLDDQFANYWDQNVNHSLINQSYCTDNPNKYVGYKRYSWGLTASDNHQGYSAHSPDNDLGVITPTAALSSFPYTPEESMLAAKHFYYILGNKMWGEYGFYDAFNPTENWYSESYLAIDQGPIIIMIENYRTGLLWDLFMSAPEVQTGLEKLEFNY